MKPMTSEWAAKAEGDFAMLERESRARKSPDYDGVCFHAQQCAEKYLKARLCEAGIPVAFRYPGESADKEMAMEARGRCRTFRNAARSGLSLDP